MNDYTFTVLLSNFIIASIPGAILINYSIKQNLLSLGIVGWLTSAIIGTACAMIYEIAVGLPSVVFAAPFYFIIKSSKNNSAPEKEEDLIEEE